MRKLLTIAVLFTLTVGCVPKGKYDEALAERDDLSLRIEAMNGTVADLRSQLAGGEGRVRQLEQELASTQSGLDELARQLSSKVAEAGALKASVTQMEEALKELEKSRLRSERAMQNYRDFVGKFQAMIDAGTLKVKIIDGQMVVELATDILFPPGAASLSKEGMTAIAEVAAVLASIPDREYQVAGHTDDVPIHSERFPSNWHLGSARAIAVTDLLIESGLDANRVSAASFAANRPVDTNRTKEGKANNRRIEIIVVPDLSSLPGYAELEKLAEE